MSVSAPTRGTQSIAFREIVLLAIDSFRLNQVRFALTALGMVIGTASLILVVTIGLSGRKYVLTSIQNIGTNLIWAEYAGLSDASIESVRDYLTVDDMRAVEQQVPGIQAASPVLNLHQSFTSGGGKERDVLILGVNPEYPDIRRLYLIAGRFFDQQDSLTHSHAALVTERFALTQFGSPEEAVGKTLAISGVPFVVIGVFRERFATFGQSEIVDETVLIPYTVARYFTGTDAVNQIYFSMTDSGSVPWATQAILKALKARHRSESVYNVGDLSEVLSMAGKTATAFSIVLPPVFPGDAAGQRGGHHEYHAGHGAFEDPRDRNSQGAGSDLSRDPAAVSGRGGADFSDRRGGGNDPGDGLAVFHCLLYRLPASGFMAVGGDRDPGLVRGGGSLWNGSRSAGGADGSGRISEV